MTSCPECKVDIQGKDMARHLIIAHGIIDYIKVKELFNKDKK